MTATLATVADAARAVAAAYPYLTVQFEPFTGSDSSLVGWTFCARIDCDYAYGWIRAVDGRISRATVQTRAEATEYLSCFV